MDKRNRFYIGCSGYYYYSWKNKFYPPKLPTKKWLEYYGSIFNTVELNGTFYRTPERATLLRYYKAVPENFRFSVKMSRYITHIFRLKKESRKSIMNSKILFEETLGNKLSCLLFQMPPSFHYTDENLENILENIPPGSKHAVELRHISWWNKKVLAAFRRNTITFCNVDSPTLHEKFVNTSGLFYLRLHGSPLLFKTRYGLSRLKKIYRTLPEKCKAYHIYFNNTDKLAAPADAQELMKIAEVKDKK